MGGICFESVKMYRSVARMGICWADMGIWSGYFLKSPKREFVLGEKLWKIFIRPIPIRKARKSGRFHSKSAIERFAMGRDETQQAICPMKPPESGFSGSRAVKWPNKAPSQCDFRQSGSKMAQQSPEPVRFSAAGV